MIGNGWPQYLGIAILSSMLGGIALGQDPTVAAPVTEARPHSGGEAAASHGGVALTTKDLLVLRKLDAARRESDAGEKEEDDDPEPGTNPARHGSPERRLPRVAAEAEGESAVAAPVPGPSLVQTPPASVSWQASGGLAGCGGFPSDSQIAVSTTHVVVTARACFAAYTKSGTLLSGYPISARSFFQPLGLEDGTEFAIDRYFDLRAIYDPYRNRFWVGALGYNSAHKSDDKRRTKFAIAVSRTQNPLDGWYLYWWNGTAHDGAANDPVYQPGDAGDYPILGIDPFGIHQTNGVSNVVNNNHSYWHVKFYPADPLANGTFASGWQYWDLKNPNGSLVTGVVQPVVHHGPTSRAYYVSRYESDKLLVWALTNPLTPSQNLARVQVTVAPFNSPQNAPQLGSAKRIKMTNLGTSPLKAVYRFGQLVLVANDARDWFGDDQMLTSIRLIRLWVLGYPDIPTVGEPSFIDRTFGKNSSTDDQPSDHMYYAWAAVEINKNHDMVVVYARSGQTLYPEVRFSLYEDTGPDIRPSRLLKAGEATYARSTDASPLAWGDCAGASVDPSDDTAIWIAQQYARNPASGATNNGNWDIWVGKVIP